MLGNHKNRFWQSDSQKNKNRLQDRKLRKTFLSLTDEKLERLKDWYKEEVNYKESIGAQKHQQLLSCLMQDLNNVLESYDEFGEDDNDLSIKNSIINFLPAYLLYLAHNSTHAPPNGFGKVQQLECENPLYYYRSQSTGKHVHELFYDGALLYLKTEASQKKSEIKTPEIKQIIQTIDFQKSLTPNRLNFSPLIEQLAEKGVKKPLLDSIKYEEVPTETIPIDIKFLENDDEALEEILDELEDTGATDSQLIVFLPDSQRWVKLSLDPDDELAVVEELTIKKDKKLLTELKKLENTATDTSFDFYPTMLYQKRLVNYDGPIAGHAGLRQHNAQIYSDILNNFFTVYKSTPVALKHIIKFITQHYGVNNTFKFDDMSKINFPKEYDILVKQLQEISDNQKFMELNLQYRYDLAAAIVEDIQKIDLQYFQVFTSAGNPNITIQCLEPPHTPDHYKVDSANHKDGWVNVIMTYFIGILNHLALNRNLPIYTNRRQSFGFLRPTITDTGESFRLSLGIQPAEYAELITHALRIVDQEIANIDKRIIKTAFTTVEEGSKKGNVLLNAMRTEERKIAAYLQVEAKKLSLSKFLDWINREVSTRYPDIKISKLAFDDEKFELKEPKIEIKNSKLDEVLKQQDRYNIYKLYLSRLLNLVRKTINHFELDIEKHIQHEKSYQWLSTRLINNAQKAKYLLAHADQLKNHELTHFYAKSTLIIEALLENLIMLRAVLQIKLTTKKQPLIETELKQQLTTLYKLDSADVAVYRTDSGEQAITASILAAITQGQVVKLENGYYEIEDFVKESKLKIDGRKNINYLPLAITFIDIHPGNSCSKNGGIFFKSNRIIESLEEITKRLKNKKGEDYYLIVDITNSTINMPVVKDGITTWNKLSKDYPNLRLIMVSSMLKHGEMSTDKYQIGQIFRFGKALPKEQALKKLSSSVQHPLTNDFMNMMFANQ